ncbi:TlpA disulfide reductase family protein [uncultured Piscinibacter sp.]|uniref:TlpA family protein disulfide reductase n=1 Tax=uncultured Piscinibacter sp. TaxID=1131835 RepID=UPI0026255B66|nr:TlpA disulfide reductase family protein [uncultured Piscinibacter sp.]
MTKASRHLAVLLITLAIGAGVYLSLDRAGPPQPLPIVPYTLLDGQTSSTAQWQGRVTLVNFWATSCAVCIKEMPKLVDTHERFRSRGFDTLAVAMSYDPPAAVVDYAQSRRLPFGVAIDNTGTIARSFGDIKGTPTSLLVDKRGRIVRRFVGEPDFAALHEMIEQLIAEI